MLEILKQKYPEELGVIDISRMLKTHPRNVGSKMASLLRYGFVRVSSTGRNHIKKYNRYKYANRGRKNGIQKHMG